MPRTIMENFFQHIRTKLKELRASGKETENSRDMPAYFALLCLWYREDDIAKVPARSIAFIFNEDRYSCIKLTLII